MKTKTRLDQLLVEQQLTKSREEAKRLIMSGVVKVDSQVLTKPGTQVSTDSQIEVAQTCPFVSRGGEKIAPALPYFNISPQDKTVFDIGSSTGGFTDCMLQNGAKHVYAIDVGRGQLDYSLRQDPRVTVMEKTNARYLTPEDLPCLADIVTIDVSFISLTKILPAVKELMNPGAIVLALIKPQFEAGPKHLVKGVVKDETIRHKVCCTIRDFAEQELGLVQLDDFFKSPLAGPKGNREFFILLKKPGLA